MSNYNVYVPFTCSVYRLCMAFAQVLKSRTVLLLDNCVFGKQQVQNQVFRLHPLFLFEKRVCCVLTSASPNNPQ